MCENVGACVTERALVWLFADECLPCVCVVQVGIFLSVVGVALYNWDKYRESQLALLLSPSPSPVSPADVDVPAHKSLSRPPSPHFQLSPPTATHGSSSEQLEFDPDGEHEEAAHSHHHNKQRASIALGHVAPLHVLRHAEKR